MILHEDYRSFYSSCLDQMIVHNQTGFANLIMCIIISQLFQFDCLNWLTSLYGCEQGVALLEMPELYEVGNFVDHHRDMRLDIEDMSYEVTFEHSTLVCFLHDFYCLLSCNF